jgi:hypothetical protein
MAAQPIAVDIASYYMPVHFGLGTAPVIPVLLRDRTGVIHLFGVPGLKAQVDGVADRVVKHWIYDKAAWLDAPALSTGKRLISALRAQQGPNDDIYVLWGDMGSVDAPFVRELVHISRLSGKRWSDAQAISDEKAEPLNMWNSIDLTIDQSETLSALWSDSRVRGVLQGLVPERKNSRTYYWRAKLGEKSNSQRLQRGGQFDAWYPKGILNNDNEVMVFWVESHGMNSTINCARAVDGKIEKCPSNERIELDGRIGDFQIARHDSGSIVAAWIVTHLTEKSKETQLQFKVLRDGHWSEGASAPANCSKFAWLMKGSVLSGAIYEKEASTQSTACGMVDMYYTPFGQTGFGKEVFVARGGDALFDALFDDDGILHVVYVRPLSPSGDEWRLSHVKMAVDAR